MPQRVLVRESLFSEMVLHLKDQAAAEPGEVVKELLQ
jgi:hypothetical protein